MNKKSTAISNLFKLGILNISILTLIALIVWTLISYFREDPVSNVNIVLIILIIPLVYYLSKDVLSIYKNLKK